MIGDHIFQRHETLIPTVSCSHAPVEGLTPHANSVTARDTDGRDYYVKTYRCRKSGGRNSIWIANEFVYYVVAARSALRMPAAAIIELNGDLCWGSEYLPGRNALPKKEQGIELLQQFCGRSREELTGLARALLLDLALLNSDRTTANILADSNQHLWYFDHEKSLLGDGRERSANPAGDLGRIDDESLTDGKVADYFACVSANRLLLGHLSAEDIRGIFRELALNEESFQVARRECPPSWVTDELFARMQRFLLRWWQFLRDRFEQENPQAYLTRLLQKSNRL